MSAHASSSSDVSGAESDRSDNDSVPAVIPRPECLDLLVPIRKYQKSWRPITDLPFVIFWSNRDFAKHPSKQAADEVKHSIEVEFGAHKTIYEVDTESENYQIFIVTGDKYEKYLFLDLGKIFCLRIRPETTKEELTSLVNHLASDLKWDSRSLQYISSSKAISISKILKLPNLSTVCVSLVTPASWIYTYQCTSTVKHQIKLTVPRTDTLSDMKQRFLCELKKELEVPQSDSCNEIWFIYKEKVLTDDLLQKTLGHSFTWPGLIDIDISKIAENCYCIPLKYEPSRKSQTLKVYVYIRPADAVAKCLFLKKNLRQLKRDKMTIVMPRDVTQEQMRLDIAKALGQKQRALQITVGKQALEDVKNLQEHLCSATHISIKVHSRRTLTFIIEHYPSHTTTKTTLHFHSSDTIQDVKSELSDFMRVPEHRVDLTYRGQTLADEKTIRSCEIQTGKEYIYVDVYDNRVLLKLHLLGSKKSPVTVISEDIEKTTVRDLKRFCKNVVPAYSSLCDFEMLVILQNRTLSDSQTLSQAGVSGRDKLQQIIVKGCKSLCFSATSTMQDGKFITFQGEDVHSSFNMIYTIEKEALLFTANIPVTENDRLKLLTSRRSGQTRSPDPDVRLWTRVFSNKRSTGTGCPHKSSTASAASFSGVSEETQRPNKELVYPNSQSVSSQTSAGDIAASEKVSMMSQGNNQSQVQICPEVTDDMGVSQPLVTSPKHSGLQTASSRSESFSHAQAAESGSSRYQTSAREAAQREDMQNLLGGRGDTVSCSHGLNSECTSLQTEQRNNEPNNHLARDTEAPPFTSQHHVTISCSEAATSHLETLPTVEVLQESRPTTSRKRLVEDNTNTSKSSDGLLIVPSRSESQCDKTKKRKTIKRTVIEDSLEESEIEGAMELKRTISTSVLISDHGAAGAHMALMESGTSASSLVDFTGDCHMSLPRHASLDEQAMWDNAKFKYINKKIIFAVANQLGKDGIPVIIQLGVPQTKIDELEAKRGPSSYACHLECLITWCKMHAEKANPDTLKEVLAANDRNDLVDVVNNILSEKTGYNTC